MQRMKQKPKYFCYVKSLGNVYPQLWYDDLTDGHGIFQYGEVDKEGPLVFFHKLTEEEKQLSFDQLNEKFKGNLNEENVAGWGVTVF